MRFQEIVTRLAEHWSSGGRVEDVGTFDPIERSLDQILPADYKYFLMWSDGGETLPPLRRLAFYPIAELLLRRSDGQPPDVLEFCTDDCDGLAFDLRVNRDTGGYPVIKYPLGDTERQEVERISPDFRAFLREVIAPAEASP